MTTAHILLIEDEPRIAQLMMDYLSHDGYQVSHSLSAVEGLKMARDSDADLVLLDRMLPDGDGLDICKALSEQGIPVIMVTAKVDEVDRLIGLNSGADDYICKPFSPKEVVARVAAVLRRSERQNAHHAQNDEPLTLDRERMAVHLFGTLIVLTRIEFDLLDTLAKQPGRIYSRDQLMDHIYQDHRVVSDRTVDSHVRKLRAKLIDADPQQRDWIGSVYGVGYRLEPQQPVS